MTATTTTPLSLEQLAAQIRRLSLVQIYHAGSGHPGGALSCADVLAHILQKELQWPKRLQDPQRNRFIMSKGHACPALYGGAAELGMIPHQQLLRLRKLESPLQGHTHVTDTWWAETSTGSLGQGFSVAMGMAMGLRYRGSAARVYAMLGDGELQEGEVWEGAMCAGHYRLDNLCVVVDHNKMQSDDLNENIMGLEPLRAKWEAFRWHAVEIDGHEFDQIDTAFAEARRTQGRPTVIIAHTIKGRGVSFMEGSPLWHGSVKLRTEEVVQALRDLDTPQSEIPRYLDGSIWNDHNNGRH